MIESVQNKHVKNWKKLKSKKGRDQQGLFLVEGDHLVREASIKLDEKAIQQVILTPNYSGQVKSIPDEKIIWVSDAVAKELADTENSQGVFAVIKKPSSPKPTAIKRPFLLLDAIQDPGNLGALIRTAAAAGFAGVVCGKGTVDPYNMKVLRGSQGMHFNLDIYESDLRLWIEYFQEQGLPVYGTALDDQAQNYRQMNSSSTPFALILGNEGRGIASNLLAMTDLNLYIPLAPQVESLNVSVAAAILMFHLYDND